LPLATCDGLSATSKLTFPFGPMPVSVTVEGASVLTITSRELVKSGGTVVGAETTSSVPQLSDRLVSDVASSPAEQPHDLRLDAFAREDRADGTSIVSCAHSCTGRAPARSHHVHDARPFRDAEKRVRRQKIGRIGAGVE